MEGFVWVGLRVEVVSLSSWLIHRAKSGWPKVVSDLMKIDWSTDVSGTMKADADGEMARAMYVLQFVMGGLGTKIPPSNDEGKVTA